MHGEKCGSSKVDVWAGSVTMMKALVGIGRIHESTGEVSCYNVWFNQINYQST